VSGLRPDLASARAVVFDLDGTLADTFDDLAASINRVRAARGLVALPVAEVRRHVGRGARNLVRRTFDRVTDDEVEAVRREFMEDYEAHLLDATRLYPGVVETLRALSGLPLAILSNKPEAAARAVAAGLGIARYFRAVRGGDTFAAAKPDPRTVRETLAPFAVPASEALIVGDSDVDVATARAAGCRVVVVRTGMWETVIDPPDAWVDDLREIAFQGG